MNWHGGFIFLRWLSIFLSVAWICAEFVMSQDLTPASYGLLQTPSSCIYHFNSSEQLKGNFSSPVVNGVYPSNMLCYYHFRASPKHVIRVRWYSFQLEEPSKVTEQCLNDYVEVIVIDGRDIQHVTGRYCGSKLPPSVATMQQSLDVIFQTSYTKNYAGFTGHYEFVPEQDVGAPTSIYPGRDDPQAAGCGGIVNKPGVHGGVITNPGYPETFPQDVDCFWLIRVDPSMKIVVKLTELDLTPGIADCKQASLTVVDGYAYQQKQEDQQKFTFCGDKKYLKEEGQKSYMSHRNRLVIRFKTTRKPAQELLEKRKFEGSPVGFHLVWTEVPVWTITTGEAKQLDEKCNDFLCRGGEYCLDDGGRICSERARYCIHNSLVCDGVPNCGENDSSDEDNCYSWQLIIIGGSVFAFVVVVILLVICCQYRHRKSRRRNENNDRNAVGGRSFGMLSSNSTSHYLPQSSSGDDPLLGMSNSLDTISSRNMRATTSDQQLLPSRGSRHQAMPNLEQQQSLLNTNVLSSLKQLEESPSVRYKELTALPQNYHPPEYKQLFGAESEDEREPFLIGNHVGTSQQNHRGRPLPPYREPSVERPAYSSETSFSRVDACPGCVATTAVAREWSTTHGENSGDEASLEASALNASLRRRRQMMNVPQITVADASSALPPASQQGEGGSTFERSRSAPQRQSALREDEEIVEIHTRQPGTKQPPGVKPRPPPRAPADAMTSSFAAVPPAPSYRDFPPPPSMQELIAPLKSAASPSSILKSTKLERASSQPPLPVPVLTCSNDELQVIRFVAPQSQPQRAPHPPPPPKPAQLCKSVARKSSAENYPARSSLKLTGASGAGGGKTVEFREPPVESTTIITTQSTPNSERPPELPANAKVMSPTRARNPPPPLVMPPPGAEGDADKSPSPWHKHRVQPTPV